MSSKNCFLQDFFNYRNRFAMSSKIYVEDNLIVLPTLSSENCLKRLGDLWDCDTSTNVGENLFKNELDTNSITATQINSIDYQLIHNKSSADQIKTLKVDGELILDCLAGLVKVEERTHLTNQHERLNEREHLICHYTRETFLIYIDSNAETSIKSSVSQKISKRVLKATHFVRGIILGAQLQADIILNRKESKDKLDIDGKGLVKFTFGQVNPSVKASLSYLDTAENKDFTKEISIRSIPAIKVETKTISEMFDKIDDFDNRIEKQKYFQQYFDGVYGLPIKFILMPIKQFIDIDIEKLYIKLSDKMLKDFKEVLIKAKDFQTPCYISKKTLEQSPYLSMILSDDTSELAKDIIRFEETLRIFGEKTFYRSVETLRKYKIGEATQQNLFEIIKDFNEECASLDIFKKTIEFVEKGEGMFKLD